MKKLIPFLAICLVNINLTVFSQQPIQKVGVLYLDNHINTQKIGDQVGELLDEHVSHIEVIKLGYNESNLTQNFDSLYQAQVDIIIGPSTSGDLAVIDKHVKSNNLKDIPNFVCPTVNTPKQEYPNLPNLAISASSNEDKAYKLTYDLIYEFGIKEMGLMYENNLWGLNLFEEFDRNVEKVSGKPFPKEKPSPEARYSSIKKYIEYLSEKDVRLITLAPWSVKMLEKFLEQLNDYNNSNALRNYDPIILVYSPMDMSAVNVEFIEGLKVFGITELYDFNSRVITEEEANTLDAVNLLMTIIKKGVDKDRFINEYQGFFGLEPINKDLLIKDVYTMRFARISDVSSSESDLKILSYTVSNDALKTEAFGGFSGNGVMRFVQTKLLPFLAFHSFPRNPFILIAFMIMTFVSFSVFMHNEYYMPFNTLFRSPRFWIWYLVFSFTTVMVVTGFLFFGFIKSNQLGLIIGAGVICPLVFNYIFKQLSQIKVPFFSSQVTGFLFNLKNAINVGLERIMSKHKFDRLIAHIDSHAPFSRVRMNVYDLILDMKSNALTKRFGQELRDLMGKLDEMFEKDKIDDEVQRENFRKKRLIKFYIEILYFVFPNEKTIRSKLINNNLVDEDELDKIMLEEAL